MKKLKSVLILMISGVIMLGLVGCGNTKTKPTNTTVQEESQLKNTVIEGNLTTDEKKKVVELTEKVAKVGIDTDYTKDNMDTMKEFFKYTTPEVAKYFPDDNLTKMLNGQKATKQIIKVEGVTFNKISKDTNGNFTVDCTAKLHVISHTDANLNGKTFNSVICKYVFNKDWKISAFAIGDYQ